MKPFIDSWMTHIWLKSSKLTCLCNMLWTSSSVARSDSGVVIESEPHVGNKASGFTYFARDIHGSMNIPKITLIS